MAEGYTLRITGGQAAGTVLPAGDTVVLGRQQPGPANLGGDPEISSRHAQVYSAGSALAVQDLGSTNGTWVNGRRIGEPTYLNPGDVLRVGQTTMTVEGPAPARDGATQMGAVPAADGGTQVAPVPAAAAAPGPQGPFAAGATARAPFAPGPPGLAPGPGPGGPARGGGKNRTPIIVGAIVAGVLALAGIVGGVIALTGDDDEPKRERAAEPPPRRSANAAPRTPAPTTPEPETGPSGGQVSPADQQNIQNVINEFTDSAEAGDTTTACSNVTDDFSIDGQVTDCAAWASANINGDPISFSNFRRSTIEGSDGPAVALDVTNTATGGVFTVHMDGESGIWKISDIAPA